MKFGRYLEDTQVPEWKRAYIDYGGLKKRINAIKEQIAAQRQSRDSNKGSSTTENTPATLNPGGMRRSLTLQNQAGTQAETLTPSARGRTPKVVLVDNGNGALPVRTPNEGYGTFGRTPPLLDQSVNPYPNSVPGHSEDHNSPPEMTLPPPIKSISDLRINELPESGGQGRASSPDQSGSPLSPRNRQGSTRVENSPATSKRPRMLTTISNVVKRANSASRLSHVSTSLSEVLATMSPLEAQFFEALDKELDKVQAFYREGEKDALLRSAVIKEQLNELKDHRKIFHAYEEQFGATLPKTIGKIAAHLSPPSLAWRSRDDDARTRPTALDGIAPSTSRYRESRQESPRPKFDPEEYQNAKKKLKRAVLEHYRGVEYLHNYRILNLTGFRKALKKFDKATQMQVSQLYHNEKIEPSILSNSKTVDDMLDEVETLYAARFESGDRKKAKNRLRASFKPQSHHLTTFRTGVFVGLSIPALISGIYEACQPDVQERVPGWSPLLQIYLAFFIPVVFGLLVSLNVIVWAYVRINYIFIFELDVRTAVDSREYAELPAFLLMTLCYAFYFTFSGLGLKIPPNAWPLAWLVVGALIFINPFPVFYPYSRRWILRKSGWLFLSGARRVEFQDFFLGDQYCSMVYTLTNLYFMGCLYQSQFTMPWGTCELPRWEFPWLLASMPSFIRLVQCVRRYLDSGQYLHLINGGKYSSSIIYYALYYNWRNAGSPYDTSFAVWVLFACIMSCYTTSWDFLMDWSLFQRGAKHPFLRKELIYTNHIWVYYFALVTNCLLRFSWIIYLPISGPHPNIRGGILGVLEALRRFQWNFFRLENEHLGNADQYRVTREVPLPYSVDPAELSDGGDEDDPVTPKTSPRSPLKLSTLRKSPRAGRASQG